MYRPFIFGLIAALAILVPFPSQAETVTDVARTVEADLGGRVGILLRKPGMKPLVAWRADERFPMTSTFKALLCAAILAQVDAGEDRLDRVITYQPNDLVTYSPLTEIYVNKGMSIADLCAATMKLSDNTAANLLLTVVGGPEGLTDFLRGVDDETTQLDRWETALNEGLPGDSRDTTTPTAITNTLESLFFGHKLTPLSKAMLETWMRDNKVAAPLIRASLPEGWTIADRTGAGGHGSRGIISMIWTPDGSPWLAAIYLTENDADIETRNRAIARVAAAMVKEILRH